MPAQRRNIVQLGIFVIIGIALLILALFLIGKNQHLIGSHYVLRAHFSNVAGLRTGNNVRYAGIEVGTVKDMSIINDTVLEVQMLIRRDMQSVIRKNALASLGADGLMGNKVITIVPQPGTADYAVDGDLLYSRSAVDIDEVLRTLAGTGQNIRELTAGLKQTVSRVNQSAGLWKLLDDTSLAKGLQKVVHNLERASSHAETMTADLQLIVADVEEGKGNLGILLRDSAIALQLGQTITELEAVALQANQLAQDLDRMAMGIDQQIQKGDGAVYRVLKDTALAGNLSRSMQHVEKGTAAFNENMEALKHNWLLRGYFKKQEKAKKKQQSGSQ
jgi:phospholipid/cholesterol/gamma-HCH transport system substrate-binding protein